MQVDPIKPTFKAPDAQRLKVKHDELLSSFAFNFNLRRYTLILLAALLIAVCAALWVIPSYRMPRAKAYFSFEEQMKQQRLRQFLHAEGLLAEGEGGAGGVGGGGDERRGGGGDGGEGGAADTLTHWTTHPWYFSLIVTRSRPISLCALNVGVD